MDKRERRYPRRDEWEEREGVWDEDEDLTGKPPLPERLGQRVRRASREIGHEVSDEMERMGERLRSWSQDAGRHAERLTDDLGGGIQRVARTGRRWMQEGEEDDDSLEDDEIEYRRRKKNKKLREKVAKEMKKQKKRLDELDEQITRPTTRSAGTKPYVEEDDVDEQDTARRSRGWGSWFGRKSDETTRPSEKEELYEGRRVQSDIDLVCVDSSIASEQAFRYALRNIPRGHTLLLVHGIFTPPGAVDSKIEDEREMGRVKDKFKSLCQRNGRRCVFREFEYTTNSELGENVCAIAERQNVGSVILGKRANASDLRRALLGSPSLSVLQQCNAPVTLIAERKENDVQ